MSVSSEEFQRAARAMNAAGQMLEALELVHWLLTGPGDPKAALPEINAAIAAARGEAS